MTVKRLSITPSIVLRIAISIVLFWFGVSGLFYTSTMVGYVPDWANIAGETLELTIQINGFIELILGLLIFTGLFLRLATIFFIIHMGLILAAVGYNEIGVRDFGLLLSGVALYLTNDHTLTLDAKFRNKK